MNLTSDFEGKTLFYCCFPSNCHSYQNSISYLTRSPFISLNFYLSSVKLKRFVEKKRLIEKNVDIEVIKVEWLDISTPAYIKFVNEFENHSEYSRDHLMLMQYLFDFQYWYFLPHSSRFNSFIHAKCHIRILFDWFKSHYALIMD